MKATHTGRLKSFESQLHNCLDNYKLKVKQIRFMHENAGKVLELTEVEDEYEHEAGLSFQDSDLTDIREIKPKIEIPVAPFWVDDSENIFKVDKHIYSFDYQTWTPTGNIGRGMMIKDVEKYLNNGTWEIVDEPKKEEVSVQAYDILNEIAEKFGMKVIKEV